MMMMILVIREVCRAQEFKQAGQTLHNGVKPFLKSHFDLEASLFLDFPLARGTASRTEARAR